MKACDGKKEFSFYNFFSNPFVITEIFTVSLVKIKTILIQIFKLNDV